MSIVHLPYVREKEIVSLLQEKDCFTPMVQKAFKQAKKSHQNQKRTSGKPYLEEHIYPVVRDLLAHFSDEDYKEPLIVTALLHDTLEDDPSFHREKCTAEFSAEITSFLKPLTKKEGENSSSLSEEEKFKINKKAIEKIAQESIIVRLVKLADRLNNFQCMWIFSETPRFDRYIRETEELFLPLAKNTSCYYEKAFSDLLRQYRRDCRKSSSR